MRGVQLKTAAAGLAQKGSVVLRAAKAASRRELRPSPLRRLLQADPNKADPYKAAPPAPYHGEHGLYCGSWHLSSIKELCF